MDTDDILKAAFMDDMKHWKGYRFIKNESEREETEKAIYKHYKGLKEIYIYQISMSNYPVISSLDFSEFCVKSKILDD